MTKKMTFGDTDITLHDEVDIWEEAVALARVGHPLPQSNARIETAVHEVITENGDQCILVANLGFPVLLVDTDPNGDGLPERHEGA